MSRLNDATPEDWDRVRKAHPAIEKSSIDYQPYIDMAMKETHTYKYEEDIRTALKDLATKKPTIEDVVNKPKHYNTGNIECIEAIEESMSSVAFKGYLKGNCMKYLWRYDYKGKQVEDLNKATWYLNKLTLVVTEENT
tara:strand:+ start:208 stop:621 length:414 start_codon:yes stop_codon:yes gene_type:complete